MLPPCSTNSPSSPSSKNNPSYRQYHPTRRCMDLVSVRRRFFYTLSTFLVFHASLVSHPLPRETRKQESGKRSKVGLAEWGEKMTQAVLRYRHRARPACVGISVMSFVSCRLWVSCSLRLSDSRRSVPGASCGRRRCGSSRCRGGGSSARRSRCTCSRLRASRRGRGIRLRIR